MLDDVHFRFEVGSPHQWVAPLRDWWVAPFRRSGSALTARDARHRLLGSMSMLHSAEQLNETDPPTFDEAAVL